MTNHPWSFVRILAMMLLGALFVSFPVIAQDTCPTAETLAELTEACQTSAPDSACTVTGDSFPLDQLPDDGQPQVIRLSSGLTLTLVNTQISAFEQGELAGDQIEIGNSAGYNLNLRSAPDANAEVVGTFKFDARLPVDGQSADGNWLRVRLEDGSTAWVSKKLVSGDPALADLPVVDATASDSVGYSLTLEPVHTDCADSAVGVFITTDGETTQRLTINDLPITMTNGTGFLAVNGKTGLTFYALAGSSSLGTGKDQQNLAAGEVLNWSDTLVAADPLPGFPALAVLEALALTPEICLVAPLAAPLEAIASPDDNTVVMTLAAGSYPAAARISVDNANWLQLTDAFGGAWVSSDLIETLGACDNLPEANAAQPAGNSASEAKLTPDQVMYSYLSARLVADTSKMQALSCASWDAQALLQSQSFKAMRAELLNVTCTTVSQTGSNAVVHCDGVIQTEYNGDYRDWQLGSYTMSLENGSWRMCGEAD